MVQQALLPTFDLSPIVAPSAAAEAAEAVEVGPQGSQVAGPQAAEAMALARPSPALHVKGQNWQRQNKAQLQICGQEDRTGPSWAVGRLEAPLEPAQTLLEAPLEPAWTLLDLEAPLEPAWTLLEAP